MTRASSNVVRGCAECVEWLGQKENPDGKGWAAGAGYGEKILAILKGILGTEGETLFRPYLVRVSIPDLNIWKEPGTDYGKNGKYMGPVFLRLLRRLMGKGLPGGVS